MTLSAFIRAELETILSHWESFARSLAPGRSMSDLALRDHAQEILEAICLDIDQPQSVDQQALKSQGLAPQLLNASATAAQIHATLRARSGFDINELASEYRVLRASVLRLWEDACKPASPDWQETIRFNEAIDQAVCESVLSFSQDVKRARDLLLGILGHDMRSPLHAIQMTASYLQLINAGEEVSVAAERLIRNGGRIQALLDDLTEFNRSELGLGISIEPTEIDLEQVFDEQIQELRAAYPDVQVTVSTQGNVKGKWDGRRIHQLLGNLVLNAKRYGAQGRTILVELQGLTDTVTFTVTNEGNQIQADVLEDMFEPLRRGKDRPDEEASLGLGLYICREVVLAHGGTIEVSSSPATTSFEVCLPRIPRNII